jgi:hypothetical protein
MNTDIGLTDTARNAAAPAPSVAATAAAAINVRLRTFRVSFTPFVLLIRVPFMFRSEQPLRR